MTSRDDEQRRTQGRVSTWPPRSAVQSGSAVESGAGLWSSWIETLKSWLRAEAGPGRLLPWVPVAFGTGIAAYFAADREPVASVAAVTAIVFCIAAFLARRHPIFPAVVMLAARAAGFATAALKTARVAHGVLARPMFAVTMKGFVGTTIRFQKLNEFNMLKAIMFFGTAFCNAVATNVSRLKVGYKIIQCRNRQVLRRSGF